MKQCKMTKLIPFRN